MEMEILFNFLAWVGRVAYLGIGIGALLASLFFAVEMRSRSPQFVIYYLLSFIGIVATWRIVYPIWELALDSESISRISILGVLLLFLPILSFLEKRLEDLIVGHIPLRHHKRVRF